MEAAKTLGMNPEAIDYRMEKRGERQAYNALNEGRFRPLKVSRDVRDLFALRAQELGVMNPFEAAQDVLDRIADVLEMTSLSGDFFPDLDNPFAELPLVGAITGAIDNMNLGAQTVGATTANNLNTGYGNLNQLQASGLTTGQEVLLANQPLYQAMARKQNLNKQRQTANQNIIPT